MLSNARFLKGCVQLFPVRDCMVETMLDSPPLLAQQFVDNEFESDYPSSYAGRWDHVVGVSATEQHWMASPPQRREVPSAMLCQQRQDVFLGFEESE